MSISTKKSQAGSVAVFGSAIALALTLLMSPSVATSQVLVLDTPVWGIQGGQVSWFPDAGNFVRGAAFNPATGNLLVVSRAGGNAVIKLDGETGEPNGSLDLGTIIEGGILPINRIAVTADGQIFVTNLILDTGTNFKIYYWENENAAPRLLFEGNPTPQARYGDGIGVYGTGNDVKLYVSGTFTNRIAEFTFDGENLSQTARAINIPADAANASIIRIPGTDHAWINGRDEIARKINIQTGEILATIPASFLSMSYGDLDLAYHNGRTIMVTGVPGTESHIFKFIDVTDAANPVLLAETVNPDGASVNSFRVGAVSINQEDDIAFVVATNVGVAAFDITGVYEVSISIDSDDQLVSEFALKQNYPNPFNPVTNIEFSIPAASHVEISVYNMLGQRMATVVNQNMSAGVHTAQFNAASLSSGVYIYRLQAGDFVQTRRMMLVK